MLLTMRPASLAAIPTYQDPFVACLQQEAAQRNLRYGLAEYWQADTITALSRDRLHIAAVDKRLSPFLWNGNPRNYQYPFEFVISNPAAAPTLQISEETIRQKFGTPDDQFACDGSFVFVYDRATTPQLRHWFAHHPDLVTLENVGDVAELYGYTLQSPIGGATTGLSVGANEEVDQDEGTLAYASLAALPAGSYAFALDLYTDNDDPGLWEIIRSVADEREVLVSATITQRGASTIMGRFDLESESNVNVVVKYNGRGALYVDRIRIARVEAGQTANSVFAGDAATTALIATEGSPQGFLSLVYPNEAYALDGRQIYFVWQWTGEPLPAHQTFEVRLWRKGESVHYGAHDARVSRASIRRIGDTYMLRLDLSGAYSVMQHGAGDYEWTVALVAIDPTYQDLQIEAQPRTLRLLP
jgi:hypothetical protein